MLKNSIKIKIMSTILKYTKTVCLEIQKDINYKLILKIIIFCINKFKKIKYDQHKLFKCIIYFLEIIIICKCLLFFLFI